MNRFHYALAHESELSHGRTRLNGKRKIKLNEEAESP